MISETNIQFNYQYRDSGNYKIFGSFVFANPDGIELEEIEAKIRNVLIDGEFFEPDAWGITKLSFDETIDEFDHNWNEFISVERTSSPPSSAMTITLLLDKLSVLQP